MTLLRASATAVCLLPSTLAPPLFAASSVICKPRQHRVISLAPPTPRHPHRIAAYSTTMASAASFYDFKPKDKKGAPYDLNQLNGKVVLVVNTASKCGFTPQFEGLEKLYKEIKATNADFEILGFPCNQFAGQDPGTDDDIQSFCQINYGVSFPVLGKTDVNGDKAEPVWEWMKKSKPGIMGLQRIKWNFEKFLIGRDGQVVQRWASTTKPESLKSAVEAELKKTASKA
ncbi:Glutathione peroxidase [Acrodontium crateriforme]|uniref:Glutathione peroxidase n=1 Tax=Acrodontium crateriforme TaxID=150365 RepID=A0AAQ3RD62_9PEZI|nr:Glutathione peroxidase [Acrodontium crateriforme]